MTQGPEEQADRHEHAGRVGEEDRGERAGAVDVGEEPADDAADADAQVDQAKPMPKYCVRSRPVTMFAIMALKAGHPMPKLTPRSVTATSRAGTVVAKASTTAPTSWARLPKTTTTRAPRRSVSEPTGIVTRRATTAMSPMSSPATSSGTLGIRGCR